MNGTCPNSKNGKHYVTQTIPRTEFEPQSFGDTMEDTLYKRIEYMTSVCSCGYAQKRKVVQEAS